MKVLITGAHGLFGTACRTVFSSHGHDIQPLSRQYISDALPRDITERLSAVDLVIHAAANTNVEQCELKPDDCYRDNFLLTDLVASACAIAKVKLIYMSSTGVYGSYQDEPYFESSKTRPTTHYHKAKRLGEKVVLSNSTQNLVIRTGWLFGGSFENPKNFVARRLEEATDASVKGQKLYANNEQRGCPTYTIDVANRLLQLILMGHQGLFNVVNTGQASRLEYVVAIIETAGLHLDVKPASAIYFNRKAKVPHNETAVNWRANESGLPEMPTWRSSLKHYVIQQSIRERAKHYDR